MFLYEKDLKDAFREKYKSRDNVKNYAFEIGRSGGADLITFEYLNNRYEYNAFEFKIDNISKAILQANYNLKYSHKSWIVLPEEKRNVIQNKYYTQIKWTRGLGVIFVKEGGYYNFFIKPMPNDSVLVNQELLKLAVYSRDIGNKRS